MTTEERAKLEAELAEAEKAYSVYLTKAITQAEIIKSLKKMLDEPVNEEANVPLDGQMCILWGDEEETIEEESLIPIEEEEVELQACRPFSIPTKKFFGRR